MTLIPRMGSHIVPIPKMVTIIILFVVTSYAGEVNSIKVRGKTIKINDTADQVFIVVTGTDVVDQTVQKDPKNPNSLLVLKNCKVNGKIFELYFARVEDLGPYRLVKIVTD